MTDESTDAAAIQQADKALKQAIPEIDAFWVGWRFFRDGVLGRPARTAAHTPEAGSL